MSRFQVRVEDGNRVLRPFTLALDDKGVPLYTSHVLPPVHISIYSQSEEARYANLMPGTGSVYAQDDISGGAGKRIQVKREDPKSNRYYYTDFMDASVKGQVQKGPAVTTLTRPANSGALNGFFVLNGTPYLVMGRIIASWASDTLTQATDLGASNVGAQSTTFFRLGTAASVESTSPAGTTVSRIDATDTLMAQQIRMDDSGVLQLAKIDVKIQRTGTVPGDVRLRVMADLNGAPSMTELVSARMLAADVPTGALTVETFRFDSATAPYLMNTQETFWIVMDVASAGAATYIDWLRDNATSTYSRGSAYSSTDSGNTWTEIDATNHADFYFNAYTQTPTTTAFVAIDTASADSVYTTDGTSYTTNTRVYANAFCVCAGLLIRALRSGSGIGAIETSEDGVNWSDAIAIDDVTLAINAMLALGETLIVVKSDSIWAVDLSALPIVTAQQLYGPYTVSTQAGKGADVWRGTAYIPFGGRIMAIEGDFASGFVLHHSVGIECLPEWDWGTWGVGRGCVAVAASRHALYALYAVGSGGGGHKLFKSPNPLRKDADGKPDPEWHGSLCTIGDGTQALAIMAVYDPGGTSAEQLFTGTTSNNIARIQLPRSANPASDSTYVYDTSTVGDLYHPIATGNYPVHPKAWTTESVTFLQSRANDYVEALYDDLLGEGWRLMPKGRLYDTGALAYPAGLASRLLARRIRLTNSLSTASPLLLAFGAAYAMRHIPNSAFHEITFTVVAEEDLSAADLGEMLGVSAKTQLDLLDTAASTGVGTRRMEDPFGRVWDRVLFLDATRVLHQSGGTTPGQSLIQVSAMGVG